jgi:RND family efflux transporter MFP subunit
MGPVPVETAMARSESVPLFGDWVAVTDGYTNANIQPQVSGYLVRQDYKEGSVVQKGQVLFEIDPRPFQAVLDQASAAVNQAKAQVGQNQAQVELQTINVNRDTPLAQAHAIAQSQLDNDQKAQQAAQASVAAAQASVGAAQAQVRSAELNLGFTRVRSLITGIAGQATTQVGNLVSPSTVLTAVSTVEPIKVYFSISEQEYLALSAQARAAGHRDLLSGGNAVPLQLTLANGDIYPHKGTIIFVDRSVSEQTGSIRVAAGFPNPGNLLRPGQFGRIKAQTTVVHDAILIPQRALNEVQGQFQVAVVGADNKIKLQPVQLGAQQGPDIVVTQGLKGGEQIVTEGMGKLRDGVPVAPEPEATAGNKPAPNGMSAPNANAETSGNPANAGSNQSGASSRVGAQTTAK